MGNAHNLERLKALIRINPEKVSKSLEDFIREYVEKLERDGVVLGMSGGIDSAVAAALCARAIGAENVLALMMPERDSRKEHVMDAMAFANSLNIRKKLIDISPYLKKMGVYKLFFLNKIPLPARLKNTLVKKAYSFYERRTGENPFATAIAGSKDKAFEKYLKNSSAYYRIKHRMRMVLLYMYAERENRLVVGAANKTESSIGYFVKHGCDDATDIMPIINLYKTQVRQLAEYLKIPKKIIDKAPSPDIVPGITDEEAIGVSYEKLDLMLLAMENNWKDSEIISALDVTEKELSHVKNLMKKSEHMRTVYAPKI